MIKTLFFKNTDLISQLFTFRQPTFYLSHNKKHTICFCMLLHNGARPFKMFQNDGD